MLHAWLLCAKGCTDEGVVVLAGVIEHCALDYVDLGRTRVSHGKRDGKLLLFSLRGGVYSRTDLLDGDKRATYPSRGLALLHSLIG